MRRAGVIVAAMALLAVIAPTTVGAKTRRCAPIEQSNFYRVHIKTDGVSCASARKLYKAIARRKSFPPGAIEPEYFVWGRPFTQGDYTCRRRAFGLGGSEFNLNCKTESGRKVWFTRIQDGS